MGRKLLVDGEDEADSDGDSRLLYNKDDDSDDDDGGHDGDAQSLSWCLQMT